MPHKKEVFIECEVIQIRENGQIENDICLSEKQIDWLADYLYPFVVDAACVENG